MIIVDIRHPVIHFPPSLYDYVVKDMKRKLVVIFNKVSVLRASAILLQLVRLTGVKLFIIRWIWWRQILFSHGSNTSKKSFQSCTLPLSVVTLQIQP